MLHRRKVHEDANVIMALGLLRSEEARVELEKVMRLRHNDYDVARAAVGLRYVNGFDAFPVIMETIRAGRHQLYRTEAIGLLAHLPLTPEQVYALLLSVCDNDDSWACTRLLSWIGERYATTAPAQQLLTAVKEECRNESVWNEARGGHDFFVRQRPDEATLRTLFEMLTFL